MSHSAVPWRCSRLAAIAALGLAAPAFAHTPPPRPTGSHLAAVTSAVDPRRRAELEVEVGRCMYRASPRAATALLSQSDPVATNMQAAHVGDPWVTFDMDRCIHRAQRDDEPGLDVGTAPAVLRMLLLEQAYLAGHERAPVVASGEPELLQRQFVATGAQLGQAKQLAAFADCVVFHDAAGSDALIRTAGGSPAEDGAAKALAPALGACLANGQRISLTVSSVRAIVADGLWNRFARPAAAQ